MPEFVKKHKIMLAIISLAVLLLTLILSIVLISENKKDDKKSKDKQSLKGEINTEKDTVQDTEKDTEKDTERDTEKDTERDTEIDSEKGTEEDTKETETETTTEKVIQDVPQNNVDNADNADNADDVDAGVDVTGLEKLRVSGTSLLGESGRKIQLRGLSTHGLSWFPEYVNRECISQLNRDFGINVLRLAMYTAEYNGYCTGGDQNYLKDLIDKGVTYATENNMYVIIDWHILSDSNPNIYIAEAKNFFAEMSRKYAGNVNVIYEICNEPNGGTSWRDVKNYALQVIPEIRKNSPDAVILVGTPNWCQYLNQATDDPITEYGNIMYTAHFYAATHTDGLRNEINTAMSKGLPVFVSEFGICDASGNGAIDEKQAYQWINYMNEKGISYVMWNISNKNETSAIFNSWCNKVNGFTYDDLSAAGKWFLGVNKNS